MSLSRSRASSRSVFGFLTRLALISAGSPAERCCNEECKADIRDIRSPLHGLRFHDLRHHAITELAESQANDSIIREIAGHVSPKMLAHYSHVQMETKRKVLDALSSAALGGSYGTNNDTNSAKQSIEQSQVRKMVEPMGFESTRCMEIKEFCGAARPSKVLKGIQWNP
jgi:hypothetical protein